MPSLSEGEDDSESGVTNSSKQLNGPSHPEGSADMEQEYHTEDSDVSDSEDEGSDPAVEEQAESESEVENVAVDPPLLPANLLEPLPSPAQTNTIGLAWDQMSRKQKQAERMRSRKAKKRIWDKLNQDTNGTGVLEAGRVAQLKRGIVKIRNRVKSGRIEKPSKPQVSGRQALLEQRKRQIELDRAVLEKPTKKTKSRPHR